MEKVSGVRGAADSHIVTNDVFEIVASIGRFAGLILFGDVDPGVSLALHPRLYATSRSADFDCYWCKSEMGMRGRLLSYNPAR